MLKEVIMSTLSFPNLCGGWSVQPLEVRRALAGGEDVNKTDQYGRTGLILAVTNRQNDIVELLLSQSSVDVNWSDNDNGWTALRAACNIDNVRNSYRRTPLQCAVMNASQDSVRRKACVTELLKNGKVDLDIGSENPSTEFRTLIREEKLKREKAKKR